MLSYVITKNILITYLCKYMLKITINLLMVDQNKYLIYIILLFKKLFLNNIHIMKFLKHILINYYLNRTIMSVRNTIKYSV